MRIAILGATSQIAKDLILSYATSGAADLILFARRPKAVTGWMYEVGLQEKYSVGDFSKFMEIKEIDAIINLVGVGNPAEAEEMGSLILDVTMQFDSLVLEYLKSHRDCKYIFFSSGAAYSSKFTQPVDEETLTEININKFGSRDWYAIAKMYAECRHRALAKYAVVDIRVFNYFSSTQDTKARFLITDVVRAIIVNEVFKTSRENIVRDYSGPQEIFQMVQAVLTSPSVNTAVDCFTVAPIDKFSLLDAMQSSFGLKYEQVEYQTGISATGQKENYCGVHTTRN
jgi:nucleoside-diphosphate-sugar epimerase